MNTRPTIDPTEAPLSLSAAFNSTTQAFSVGTENGFCVFDAESCQLKTSRNLDGGVGIAEMLGNYNYLALVGGGRNPKWPQTEVVIWDDAKQKPAMTLRHKQVVLRVRLNKAHIVVVLQNSVHLYDFQPLKKLAVYETADNHLGLCCLGTDIIGFPGRSDGKLQVVELERKNVSIIPAHTGALRALELSKDGQFLATASEQGTLIRVFSTVNLAKIAELRRGVDAAFIFSLSFSPDSSMLAITSDKSTLHVFDVSHVSGRSSAPGSSPGSPYNHHMHSAQIPRPDEDVQPNKWGFLSKLPLMPRIFNDMYSFTSAPFDMGDEPLASGSSLTYLPSLPGRSVKGLLGWIDDSTIISIGTGRDGKWERFKLGQRSYTRRGQVDEIRREIWRDGWKRYLSA